MENVRNFLNLGWTVASELLDFCAKSQAPPFGTELLIKKLCMCIGI